jgi:hypothetical protein
LIMKIKIKYSNLKKIPFSFTQSQHQEHLGCIFYIIIKLYLFNYNIWTFL